MITSVFLLASWLGCMIISIFGMRLGRRTWIIAGSLVQAVGTVISASSYSSGQLIAGRVLIVRGRPLSYISSSSVH
jgi:MFS family permease